MDADISILVATAFSVGLIHTLLGPDHYVPFVAMSKSNGWSAKKTLWITTLCGLGHVAGSVVVGVIGLMLGTAIFKIEALESFRGDGAAWLLIGFGLAYFTWGIFQAIRHSPHGQLHTQSSLPQQSQDAASSDKQSDQPESKSALTPWVLFLIFVFGPCEVLIPLLMYPAAKASGLAIAGVVAAFTIGTVGTMLACVGLLVFGLRFIRLPDMHRYANAMAGFAVLMCGMMVKLGL